MKFKIAIRSYKRAHLLKSRTWKIIEKEGLIDVTYVFVASEDERNSYLQAIENLPFENCVIGEVGALKINKFITNFFEEGQPLLLLDDDIIQLSRINFKENGKVSFEPATGLYSYFQKAFELIQREKLPCFSIGHQINASWSKDNFYAYIDFRFVHGACWGMLNSKELMITELIHDDAERTLRLMGEGKPHLHLMQLFLNLGQQAQEGGMKASEERMEIENKEKNISYLVSKKLYERFPQFLEEEPYRSPRKDVVLYYPKFLDVRKIRKAANPGFSVKIFEKEPS